MYATLAALALLGVSLGWTALNKSGVPPFSWYVSLILIGLAFVIFWIGHKGRRCPPLPKWLTRTIAGVLIYMVFQAIPLPLALLGLLSPRRAELTRALEPVVGHVAFAPISVDPAAHILWFLTIAGCTAAFFLLREIAFRLKDRVFLVLLPLFAVAAFEALLGLLQVAAGAEQAVGSYNSRDHYCCLLEMTLPLCIVYGLMFFNRRHHASIQPALQAIGSWVCAVFLILGILFSLSRAGWVDSFVSLLVISNLLLFPKTQSSLRRLAWTGGLTLFAGIIFVIASPPAMLERLVSTLTPDSNGRVYIWHQLTPLMHEFRWFGAGLMGFDPLFLKYQDFVNAKRVDFAHNDFLQYLIELGLLGFIPLMAALGGVVWPIAKGALKIQQAVPTVQSEARSLLAGCIGSCAALFLHSLVDFNFYIPANMLAFAWVLALGSALAVTREAKVSPGDASTDRGGLAEELQGVGSPRISTSQFTPEATKVILKIRNGVYVQITREIASARRRLGGFGRHMLRRWFSSVSH